MCRTTQWRLTQIESKRLSVPGASWWAKSSASINGVLASAPAAVVAHALDEVGDDMITAAGYGHVGLGQIALATTIRRALHAEIPARNERNWDANASAGEGRGPVP